MAKHNDGGRRSASKSRGFLTFIRDLLVIVVIAFVISFGLKTFLVRSFYIPSGSMLETLQINDRILVNQLVPAVVDVNRGDVVVFSDPGGWVHPMAFPESSPWQEFLQKIGLAAEVTNEYVVKRVIGVGGDNVVCCDADGQVQINGVSIAEPYISLPDGVSAVSELEFDVTVPEGSVWLMGDNRYSSKDSRYNQDQPGKGFVSESEIVGRAFVINWPFEHFGWLSNYPEVFEEVNALDVKDIDASSTDASSTDLSNSKSKE